MAAQMMTAINSQEPSLLALTPIFWVSSVEPPCLLVFTSLAPEQEQYLPILQATLERLIS